MHSSADSLAVRLAANRSLSQGAGHPQRRASAGPGRADQIARAAAESRSQFAAALAQNAAAAPTVQETAASRHSAAWEDFFSHRQIGTSEDGYPIVGETEAELAKTLATYARIAEAKGFSPEPTETVQARVPVYDGLMGPQLGYHQVTLVRLPFPLTPVASGSLPPLSRP
ncbi:hypothetical protein [Solidesulfovibrio sp.]